MQIDYWKRFPKLSVVQEIHMYQVDCFVEDRYRYYLRQVIIILDLYAKVVI